MNPLNLASLAGIVLLARSFGRPTAVRALTLSQSTIKGFPGRQNQDLAEIQGQSAQVAEQVVQLAEAIYDPNWSDPDILAVQPNALAVVDALRAGLASQ